MCYLHAFRQPGLQPRGVTCAEVSTMMVMVTIRLDPAHEARISLCMCNVHDSFRECMHALESMTSAQTVCVSP